MKYIALVFASLIFCLILCSISDAVISSSVYANGGSIIVNTDESWETSDNLMRFGTVNDSYEYGGKSQTIVSLGRTGIMKTDSTRVETLEAETPLIPLGCSLLKPISLNPCVTRATSYQDMGISQAADSLKLKPLKGYGVSWVQVLALPMSHRLKCRGKQ